VTDYFHPKQGPPVETLVLWVQVRIVHFSKLTEVYCYSRQFIAALCEFLVLQGNEVIDASSRINLLGVNFRLNIPLDGTLGVDALSKLEQLAQGRYLHAGVFQLLS